jgi:hypothetical protein
VSGFTLSGSIHGEVEQPSGGRSGDGSAHVGDRRLTPTYVGYVGSAHVGVRRLTPTYVGYVGSARVVVRGLTPT